MPPSILLGHNTPSLAHRDAVREGGIHSITLAQKATLGSHRYHQRSPSKPEPTERTDSTTKNGLTFLAPLTYPLIIEELRPEETPRGRF